MREPWPETASDPLAYHGVRPGKTGGGSPVRPASERSIWKQLPNGFSLFLIVLLASNYFAPFADLDFSWQIRTGERIVQTGQLQPTEAFSYTIRGRPLPDYEWLYEVIVWSIWSGLGFGGLKLLRTILVAAPLLLLGWRLRGEGVRWHGIALTLLTAVFILSRCWNLRPLFCTLIGLLLVSGWLHDHCHKRRPLPWWLPVVMLAWGNLHPGVIMGQTVLAGAIVWEGLNRWWKINPPLDRAAWRRLALVGGLGLAASWLSPQPLERLLYPFRPELAHPIQRVFAEMQPLYRSLGEPPFATVLVYLVASCVGLSVVLRFRQYRLWEVGLLLALTALANLAVRSLQDWTFIMLALGVPHLTVLLKQTAKQRRLFQGRLPNDPTANNPAMTKDKCPGTDGAPWEAGHCSLASGRVLVLGRGELATGLLRALLRSERICKRVLNTPLLRFQWTWPTAAFVLLAAGSLVPPLARKMPLQNDAAWPVRALDWCAAQGLKGRFFGPPDYGSYVGWRLGDRGQCYVDTRGFFFPPELIEDSHYVPQLGPEWRPRLQRIVDYGTDYFLLETTGPRGEFWRALQPYLDRPLYCDEQTVLLSTAQVLGALPFLDGQEAPAVSPGKRQRLAEPDGS